MHCDRLGGAEPSRGAGRGSRGAVLQRERVAQAKMQTATIAAVPYVVGYHWWRWADETPGGRWREQQLRPGPG